MPFTPRYYHHLLPTHRPGRHDRQARPSHTDHALYRKQIDEQKRKRRKSKESAEVKVCVQELLQRTGSQGIKKRREKKRKEQ